MPLLRTRALDRQKRRPAHGFALLRHIQMKQNENVDFRFVSSLYVLAMRTRRPDKAVLGKCRSVTPSIIVCFMSFQVFPYYIIIKWSKVKLNGMDIFR